MPVARRGAHTALSPNFGAPAMPAPWQTVHVDSKIFLPSTLAVAAGGAGAAAAGAGAAVAATAIGAAGGAAVAAVAGAAGDAAAGAAGSFQFAPALFAMNTTARSTSTFARSELPPFGGIERMPLIA